MNNKEIDLAEIIADGVRVVAGYRVSISPLLIRKLIEREDKAEEEGYKRGSFHTGSLAIAAIICTVIAVKLLYASSPPAHAHYLPPTPGIVIDTSEDIRDSGYLHHRQASPQTQHIYDSERRADTPKDGTLEPKHLFRTKLPSEDDDFVLGSVGDSCFFVLEGSGRRIVAEKHKGGAWIVSDSAAVLRAKKLITTKTKDSL